MLLLVPAYPGCPGPKAVKLLCVCVCACVSMACVHFCVCLQVALVNDPRSHNPYDHLYTVEFLGNMTDSPLVLYINQPVDVLKDVALKSIQNSEV